MGHTKVYFAITDNVHILDLAGPVQVFYEAKMYGQPYEIVYISNKQHLLLASNLLISNLHSFDEHNPGAEDIVFVPGFTLNTFLKEAEDPFLNWLHKAHTNKAIICSVCTGAFALAASGVLNGKPCTTHWRYVDVLQKTYPALQVNKDKVFVQHQNIYTSAGVTTGIDLALHLLEERHGAEFTFQVAKEIVAYIRRGGNEEQQSIFLQYRHHINSAVHSVQDYILKNLDRKITNEELSSLACTSLRNLTRLFKTTTGITIGAYTQRLRKEKAVQLLKGGNKVSYVAAICGFESTAQLRSMLKKNKDILPDQL